MKILAFCAVLALVSSCNSSPASVGDIREQDIQQEHQQILALQKYLTTQSPEIDQLSAIKLADIVEESTSVITQLGKLTTSEQESERLGTVNVLAMKESILLLAAQQIPKHARFTAKY